MTTTDPLSSFGTNVTSQNQSVPGRSDQVENNAGGFVFQIDPLAQLRRSVIIKLLIRTETPDNNLTSVSPSFEGSLPYLSSGMGASGVIGNEVKRKPMWLKVGTRPVHGNIMLIGEVPIK